jgi:hypothetical protein
MGSPYFWGMRNTSCKCRAFLLWILMQNNTCTVSKFCKFLESIFFFVCLLHKYSYIMIWYTGSYCHASKRTQPSIPHYNITICVWRGHTKQITKNFQNLLILEGSFSINILSKNTLHLYNGFLAPQNEHDLVSAKSILKVLLPIRNF